MEDVHSAATLSLQQWPLNLLSSYQQKQIVEQVRLRGAKMATIPMPPPSQAPVATVKLPPAQDTRTYDMTDLQDRLAACYAGAHSLADYDDDAAPGTASGE